MVVLDANLHWTQLDHIYSLYVILLAAGPKCFKSQLGCPVLPSIPIPPIIAVICLFTHMTNKNVYMFKYKENILLLHIASMIHNPHLSTLTEHVTTLKVIKLKNNFK